ncbi:4-alpha-glucanotransferase [Schlesneria sp. T3-172]|uniref:4-alpha-glucanotransferase n=1 Tax=Schlesneria sphaerica TaxID=3373610 RepID=UPI0037C8FF12
MLQERASGVLLHPTSFPTRYGIGDLGPSAYHFIDWLEGAEQRYWQVLPLCPTDMGDSPYQSPSSFAGNPLLISPDLLARDGLLNENDLASALLPEVETAPHVDFQRSALLKNQLLSTAVLNFRNLSPAHELHQEFAEFKKQHHSWVNNHARFMALRDVNRNRPWRQWTEYVTAPDQPVMPELEVRFEYALLLQFFFFRQWHQLRQYARERNIQIIGDIPIYVSHDSVDVWAHQSLFQLDEHGDPTRVAGVPPDYFAATGQLWNNPLYNWDAMEQDGFRWWIHRLETALQFVDLVRLDHFRGFEAYWSVAAGEATAMNGHWVPGPRGKLLTALCNVKGADPVANASTSTAPIIAEDLGMITEEVHALRKEFHLPGMKVLQFMLPGEPWDNHRPEEFEANSVAYTGTHDNDTTLGWFRSHILPNPDQLERLKQYTRCEEHNIAWEFIEIAWRSGSHLAIAPLQDLFSMGSEARMNTPGTSGPGCHNWRWKYSPGLLTREVQERLANLTRSTNRAIYK